MRIKSIEQLEGYTLQRDDEVHLNNVTYGVRHNGGWYLNLGGNNDKCFTSLLGINHTDAKSLASTIYNHSVTGEFPEAYSNEKLTDIVRFLFKCQALKAHKDWSGSYTTHCGNLQAYRVNTAEFVSWVNSSYGFMAGKQSPSSVPKSKLTREMFLDTKIWLPTKEVNLAYQNILLSLGFKWPDDQGVKSGAINYIRVNSLGNLAYGIQENTFREQSEREIYYDNIIKQQNNSPLTNTDHEHKIGQAVIVPRQKATITRGERPEGSFIRGKTSRTAITVGHLSYRAISG